MDRIMLKSKIHRATITHADLSYEGSITIDQNLMEAADLLDNEQVQIWNVTSGTRLATYAITGKRGSGLLCCNGAAAHLVRPGDLVIIASFVSLPDEEARAWKPKLVFVDEHNVQKELHRDAEIPGPYTAAN